MNIFPPGSAYAAIVTAIWLGAILTIFFNLRLGWSFSGLIVPGYMTTILLIKPFIALTIFIEAIIAYMIVYLITNTLTRFKYWYSFIGKDAFFLILLVSIIIQIVFDNYVLSGLGSWINSATQNHFDTASNLHSFGIIIIALTVNVFYHSGLRRSCYQMIFIAGILYLFIRYVLMTATNYNLNTLAHTYVEMGAYIAATAKRYIILIITACVAIYYRNLYAWKYNGILIPALLTLEWLHPWVMLISIIEAIVLFFIAKALIALHILRERNFEGSKRYSMFFTISFFYKMIIYLISLIAFPGVNLLNLYGFGYLLTTLIAIKIFDYNPVLRVSRSLIQVIVISIVIGNLVGYAMTVIATPALPISSSSATSSLMTYLNKTQANFYLDKSKKKDSSNNTEQFESNITKLINLPNAKQSTRYAKLENNFKQQGFTLTTIGNKYFVLTPSQHQSRNIYIINSFSKSQYAITTKLNNQPAISVMFSALLMSKIDAKLVIAYKHKTVITPTLKALFQYRSGRSSVNAASNNLKRISVSIDQHTPTYCNRGSKAKQSPILSLLQNNNKSALLKYLDSNPKLSLNLCEMIKSLFTVFYANHNESIANNTTNITNYIQSYFNAPANIAAANSEKYIRPSISTLKFSDINIIQPGMQLSHSYTTGSENTNLYFNYLAANLESIHYKLLMLKNKKDQKRYIIYQEAPQSMQNTKRYWGLYIYNLQQTSPYILEAPHPKAENHIINLASELFSKLQAYAILLSTTDRYANLDRSSDLTQFDNQQSLFNLTNQVLLRENKQNLLPIQLISAVDLPHRSQSDKDIYLSFKQPAWKFADLQAQQKQLFEKLTSLGFSVDLASGKPSSAGLEVGQNAQSRYLKLSKDDDFAILWVTPNLRSKYNFTINPQGQLEHFKALNVRFSTAPLATLLDGKLLLKTNKLKSIKKDLDYYINTGDIVALHKLLASYPEEDFHYIVDPNIKLPYLIIKNKGGILAVIAISPLTKNSMIPTRSRLNSDIINNFIHGKYRWLYF